MGGVDPFSHNLDRATLCLPRYGSRRSYGDAPAIDLVFNSQNDLAPMGSGRWALTTMRTF